MPRAGTVDKEKLSRVRKRREKESRKKRRVVLAIFLALGTILALGAALNIPYINVAREAGSWLGGLLSGSGVEEEPAQPEYLFFTHPQGGGRIRGDVSVLVGLCREGEAGEPRRVIMNLALMTYDEAGGGGEVYLIPENSVAYNSAGQPIGLDKALEEEGGESLLGSTVANLSGSEVDYLFLVDFWDAVRMLQELGLPRVTMGEDTVLVNPVNGETNYLAEGQEIGDADRLLFYFTATDYLESREAFFARLERARDYLPHAFPAIASPDIAGLEDIFDAMAGDYLLEPGAGSAREDGRYMASVIEAFSELDEGRLVVRAVPAVEVLNGCGIPDLGSRVGDRLAALGVPVAGTGANAKITVDGEEINDFSHDTSVIIFRSEDERVRAFAKYLGVLLSVDDVEFEPGPGAEVVLIAGRDLGV